MNPRELSGATVVQNRASPAEEPGRELGQPCLSPHRSKQLLKPLWWVCVAIWHRN